LLEAVGQHHLLDGAALLGDFQFAVAVGALERDMQFGEQVVLGAVLETQLFRENQRAARQQSLVDASEQFQATFRRDELQGEVERDQRGGLQIKGENVGL